VYDSNTVRSFLFVYAIFASIAVVLLWKNSAAPDGLKNVGILVASILPVLIVALPYLKQEPIEQHFTFILFYDSKDKTITWGDKSNPYFSNYLYMFTNLPDDALKAENFSELMGSKGLNIIEKGILEALFLKFSTHWDIELKKFEGPIGASESWTSNSKMETQFIELAKIQEVFQHNPFIVKSGFIFPQLSVPPSSKISVKISENSRAVIFNNPYSTLEIVFHPSSGMVAQQGIWGVLKPDGSNMNRYFMVEYKVDCKLLVKGTKAYSPEMKSYRRWFENVCDELSRYDWNVVDKKVESTLNREAISKILGP